MAETTIYPPLGRSASADGSGSGGAAVWGGITGSLGDQTDLQNRLSTLSDGIASANTAASSAQTAASGAATTAGNAATAAAAAGDKAQAATDAVAAKAKAFFQGTVADQAGMLAKTTAVRGDWVKRTDTQSVWTMTGSDATALASWTEGQPITLRAYTNTDLTYSTDYPAEKVTYNWTISADTNAVRSGTQVEVTYNPTGVVQGGGYAVGHKTVLNKTGSGTTGKFVGDMNQLYLAGGNILAGLGYEAVISGIQNGSAIATYCAYYVPNMAAVPNIGNVAQFYSFGCDHTEAIAKNSGTYNNAVLTEISPPFSLGLVADRYYSCPYDQLTDAALQANVLCMIPVHVPHRATLKKIGVNVSAGVASTNIRMGLFQATPTGCNLVLDCGTIDSSSAGAKELSITQRVDSGTYFLGVLSNGTPTVSFQTLSGGASIAQRGQLLGQTSPTAQGASMQGAVAFSYAYSTAFPATLTHAQLVRQPTPSQVHAWFRV